MCIALCPLRFCGRLGGEGAACFVFVVFRVSCCCGSHVALSHSALFIPLMFTLVNSLLSKNFEHRASRSTSNGGDNN